MSEGNQEVWHFWQQAGNLLSNAPCSPELSASINPQRGVQAQTSFQELWMSNKQLWVWGVMVLGVLSTPPAAMLLLANAVVSPSFLGMEDEGSPLGWKLKRENKILRIDLQLSHSNTLFSPISSPDLNHILRILIYQGFSEPSEVKSRGSHSLPWKQSLRWESIAIGQYFSFYKSYRKLWICVYTSNGKKNIIFYFSRNGE